MPVLLAINIMNKIILYTIALLLHCITAYSQPIIEPKWGGYYVGTNALYADRGSFIVTSANYGISIWDNENRKGIYDIATEGNESIRTISDSVVLTYSMDDNSPAVAYNVYTGMRLYSISPEAVSGVTDKIHGKVAYSVYDTIFIANTATGQNLQTIHFPDKKLGSPKSFNSLGSLLLTAYGGSIHIIDLVKGVVIFTKYLGNFDIKDNELKFHNTNNTLIVLNNKTKSVDVWDPIANKMNQSIDVKEQGRFSLYNYGFPSKDNFISVAHDSVLQIWDIKTGKLVSSYQNDFYRIKGIQFNADSSLILVYSDSKVCVLNANDLSLVSEIPKLTSYVGSTRSIKNSSIHPFKEEVLVTLENEVYVYNWKKGTVQHVFRGFNNSRIANYNEKKSELLVEGSPYYTTWNASDGSYIDTVKTYYSIGNNLFFYPPHKLYQIYAEPKGNNLITYYLYKIPEKREICSYTAHQTNGSGSYKFIISDNILKIAGNVYDSCITIFDTTGTLISRICDSPYLTSFLDPHHFSVSSDTIYVIHNKETTKMWDVKKGALIREFKGVMPLKGYLNASRRRLVTISQNRSVDIWDFLSGTLIRSIYEGSYIKDVRFNPKRNEVVILDNDQALGAFNPNTGDRLYSFPKGSVNDFLFNSEGSLLFTWGGEDNIIHVRDASTGKSIAQLVGHNHVDTIVVDEKNGLVLSSGGSLLVGWDIASILPTRVETDNQEIRQENSIRIHYADGSLHITLLGTPLEREKPVALYTVTGECVLKDNIGANMQTTIVPVSSVGSGVYYFTTELFGKKTTQLIHILH